MSGIKHIAAAVLIAALAACSEVPEQQAQDGPPQGGPPPLPAPVTLASRPGVTGGEAQYVENCAMCHGPNGMGTGLLARRMDVPLLEERTDLNRDYVILAARQGIGNMPSIPRGEVSDAELDAIADYLSAPKSAPAGTAQ